MTLIVRATLSLILLAGMLQPVAAQTAQQIISRSEDILKGASSKGSFRMVITTPDYTRSMEMDSWWVGTEKALIVITSPRREAGNKTLKVKNELWMYLQYRDDHQDPPFHDASILERIGFHE